MTRANEPTDVLLDDVAEAINREVLRAEHITRDRTMRDVSELLPLPTVVFELKAWLADEHQWHVGKPGNWKSLITDVERSPQRLRG